MADPMRIVDAVFGRQEGRRRTRLLLAILAGVALHLAAVVAAIATAPSLETWSAELAARVHAELTREQVVDLPKPPKKTPPPVVDSPDSSAHHVVQARRPAVGGRHPSPPAQAGKIIAADPSAPVDLPGTSFVTGRETTYAGGVTTATGTNHAAVTGPIDKDAAPSSRPRATRAKEDLSTTVSLEETSWSCPWPHEADAEQIDEQTVILSVLVRGDGSAESVRTVSDPGHGFASAAKVCALSTRFIPAHDPGGHPVRAESPPIRVHFTR